MSKSACFDVIGTCFGFDKAIETIEARLGPKFKALNLDSKSLFFSWFYAAQRDFTYNSMVDNYTPIAKILKHTFRRACLTVDLPASDVTDKDIESIMEAFVGAEPRPGLKACFDGLRESGWDVYGVTNGAKETSLNYFKNANIQLDDQHLLSCDTISKAKPDMKVYEVASDTVIQAGSSDKQKWFVAAHSWDLIAARKAGFKTAYLDYEEHDPVTEVFGKFDLYASSCDDLLEKLRAV